MLALHKYLQQYLIGFSERRDVAISSASENLSSPTGKQVFPEGYLMRLFLKGAAETFLDD